MADKMSEGDVADTLETAISGIEAVVHDLPDEDARQRPLSYILDRLTEVKVIGAEVRPEGWDTLEPFVIVVHGEEPGNAKAFGLFGSVEDATGRVPRAVAASPSWSSAEVVQVQQLGPSEQDLNVEQFRAPD